MADETSSTPVTHANPYLSKPPSLKITRMVGIVITGAVLWYFVAGIPGSATTCVTLVSKVVDISKQNSNGLAVRVIDVVEPKQASKSDKELKCSGIGILSNGTKQKIAYKAYEEYGKWWVQYEPQGMPFS